MLKNFFNTVCGLVCTRDGQPLCPKCGAHLAQLERIYNPYGRHVQTDWFCIFCKKRYRTEPGDFATPLALM